MTEGEGWLSENNDPPMNLQTIAEYLVSVNDDILPDDYFEVDWLQMPDKDCLDLIRLIFLHGSCAEFAYALPSEAWLADCAIQQSDMQQGALRMQGR